MSKIMYADHFNLVSGLLKLFSRFLILRGRLSTAAFIMLLFVEKNVVFKSVAVLEWLDL